MVSYTLSLLYIPYITLSELEFPIRNIHYIIPKERTPLRPAASIIYSQFQTKQNKTELINMKQSINQSYFAFHGPLYWFVAKKKEKMKKKWGCGF